MKAEGLLVASTLLVSFAAAGPIERRGRNSGSRSTTPSSNRSSFGSNRNSNPPTRIDTSSDSSRSQRVNTPPQVNTLNRDSSTNSNSNTQTNPRTNSNTNPQTNPQTSPRTNSQTNSKKGTLRQTGIKKDNPQPNAQVRQTDPNRKPTGAGYSVDTLRTNRNRQTQRTQQEIQRNQRLQKARLSNARPRRAQIYYVNGVPRYEVDIDIGDEEEYGEFEPGRIGAGTENDGSGTSGTIGRTRVGGIRELRTGIGNLFQIADGPTDCGELNIGDSGMFARVPPSLLGKRINGNDRTKLKYSNCGKLVHVWHEDQYTPAWIVGSDGSLGAGDIGLSEGALARLGITDEQQAIQPIPEMRWVMA